MVWLLIGREGSDEADDIRCSGSGCARRCRARRSRAAREGWIVSQVDKFADSYGAAANGMMQGRIRHERALALCGPASLMRPANGEARDWSGIVEILDSVGDGRGVLVVRISPHITLSTTNNTLSESISNFKTLIALNSPVFAAASKLQVGDRVVFSGKFFPSASDCMEEKSLTVTGAMTDPEFLFRFSAIAPAE